MATVNRLAKLQNRERFMRNGKIMLNLLRYDIEWVVRRWGYFDKKNTCEFFEFVVSLFKEDLGEDVKKTKTSKSKKSDTLPDKSEETPAIVSEPEPAGVKEEESL